ncbi:MULTISPECIES: cytochrome c [Pseudoxanthomonas]|uniref:Mono/diheme cytochrome c family protein n=1 Tax=Pseudoxanthomonas winnipegensis TaxID=2480810 RepID=A0AAW8GIT6_9GAMM|nr:MULTISPECIES: cytochrome c [Pseudoxanthomonas]MDQ1120994.1 mono/diheme cytochrome c family protein [Pseudoxanthomonas winnipegensis]MDQ1134224.1 mono/diheme cytochrome c family protein [Pseudoxanthomonas winnipegensis]MDR6139542.1 mono/diheme cytochrome c family protein [Pseudoxanthomonas sp. SORGH_AS_0997]
MMRKKRLFIAALVAAILFLSAFAIALLPTRTRAIAPVAQGQAAALLEQGRYLAAAGDCTACHTAPGGAPFAGGLPIASPIGTIYSTNITPDPDTGIGRYSLDQFDRALRHGIRADGGTLYPAMPYPSYARIGDDDVRALYVYFMQGVKPVERHNQPTGIAWPLSLRWPLALWRRMFAPSPDALAARPALADARLARGAYLVEGLGHCGSCHTPRALTMQEEALDASGKAYLSGGQVIDGWTAINLRGDVGSGLGGWSEQDIVDSLRTGRNPHAGTVGSPMGDVTVHSMQYLRADDLHAIAAYLKSLPAQDPAHPGFRADPSTAAALAQGQDATPGAALYLDNCAGCHRSDGAGDTRTFPSIAGNPTVLAPAPTSLLRLILDGSRMPATPAAPSDLGMPGFAWRLDDAQVAQLASFVRAGWGNRADPVSAAQVRKVRAQLERERAERAKPHDPTSTRD